MPQKFCLPNVAVTALLGLAVGTVPTGSHAADALDAQAQTAPPPASISNLSGWASTVSLNAQFEGGVVFNPAGPKTNFGQLFTDHANQATLNQVLLTFQRAIDPKQTEWDLGFKLQGLYGSDARYTHFLGEFDQVTQDRYQFDVIEANITLHAPVLTDGGIDVKAGQYSTPIGFETIDPSTNPFYSHSYIFNFGIPLKHTGAYATVHATSVLDIYAGIDSGVNTSLGARGDNNSAAAELFGFGLNLLDGNLTVLALSHVGPENASRAVANANHYQRYLNDVTVTYKVNPTLSVTSEVNYIRDDFARAEGYGFAQYVSYTLNDTLTLNGRAEVWRDTRGFFVAAFPGNQSFVNSELGVPATTITAGPVTYGEITAGVTYKPKLPGPISTLMVRPEIRYDRGLAGGRPFNNGRDQGAVTFASDLIVGF